MAFHEISWFDRKPLNILLEYRAQLAAPHVITERWTYTVPRNRIAYAELLGARILRLTASAAALEPTCWIYYRPSGGAEEIIVGVSLITNNIGDQDREFIGHSLLLFPGDRIRAITWDQSPDGNVEFHVRAKLTEFDAYLYVGPRKTMPEPRGRDVQAAGPKPDPVM